MIQPKILAFAGSLRKDSLNKKLVKIAAKGAEDAGAIVTVIDLIDYQMPLYNGDDEAAYGLPEKAHLFKSLLLANDGFLIASPEYNSSLSGVLKNTIDWASRQATANEPSLQCFNDKVAILMSASPGGLGGLRGLVALRSILGNINTIVLPDQKAISNASDAFDAHGNLKNKEQEKAILNLGKKLTDFIRQMKGK